MIPALGTFENMRECLGAISVTLPTAADLISAHSSKSQYDEERATAAAHKVGSFASRSCYSESTLNFQHSTSNKGTHATDHPLLDLNTKSWSPKFATERYISDEPYGKTMGNWVFFGQQRDVLDTLLEDKHSRIPSFQIQTLKSFCQQGLTAPSNSDSMSRMDQQVWYWHACSREHDRQLPQWIPISDLGHTLWEIVSKVSHVITLRSSTNSPPA